MKNAAVELNPRKLERGAVGEEECWNGFLLSALYDL